MKLQNLFAFLGGAAVGAALALLLAPDSGKNTRDKISQKLHHGQERTKELLEQELQALNHEQQRQ